MSTDLEIARANVLEKVVIEGDLSVLKPADRVMYYRTVCESVGLNPFTKPFEYIKLNNKLTLYAKRDATDQLRKIHGISVQIVARENVGDVYVVTARATDMTGRTDESVGAVPLKGLQGEALANAFMKAETKAKRRVTLSIAGLGMLDETEATTIPGAQVIDSGQEILVGVAPPTQNGSEKKTEGTFTTPDDQYISDPQRKRLFAIARENGVSTEDIKAHLANLGIKSSNEILKSQYDGIIAWIQGQKDAAEI